MKKVNGKYYIQNPQFFPWGALKLDPPLYGPVHVAMLRVISVFPPHKQHKAIITATPTEIARIADSQLTYLLEKARDWEGTYAPKDEYTITSLNAIFDDFADLLSEYLTDLARRNLFHCPADLWIGPPKEEYSPYGWGG